MRKWINIINEMAHTALPDILYHGTSDYQWANQKSDTLYLTRDREDAARYADEAVVGDFYELDGREWEEGMEMPSSAIIVEFRGSDLIALQDRFEPDWGWEQAEETTPWWESLQAVGSFCIVDFREKNLGTVTPAFPENLVEKRVALGHEGNKEVAIYENPTKSELRRLLVRYGELRGMVEPEGSFYVWPASEWVHHTIHKWVGHHRYYLYFATTAQVQAEEWADYMEPVGDIFVGQKIPEDDAAKPLELPMVKRAVS